MLYPTEFGGTRPADFDSFYEVILLDELARVGAVDLAQYHLVRFLN